MPQDGKAGRYATQAAKGRKIQAHDQVFTAQSIWNEDCSMMQLDENGNIEYENCPTCEQPRPAGWACYHCMVYKPAGEPDDLREAHAELLIGLLIIAAVIIAAGAIVLVAV